MGSLTYPLHLARRFVGSLSPYPPAPADEAWAIEHLTAGERAIWVQLSNPDRRHAVCVARDVVARLGPRATRPVVAAALLHDSGKLVSGYGTLTRVGVTLLAAARGHERLAVGEGRLASYLRHDELGADALALAGADPLTITWAREHHWAPSRWTLDPVIAAALKAADDD